jgi:hypothetical protein
MPKAAGAVRSAPDQEVAASGACPFWFIEDLPEDQQGGYELKRYFTYLFGEF